MNQAASRFSKVAERGSTMKFCSLRNPEGGLTPSISRRVDVEALRQQSHLSLLTALRCMPLLGFGLFLKQYRKVFCLVVTSNHICRPAILKWQYALRRRRVLRRE